MISMSKSPLGEHLVIIGTKESIALFSSSQLSDYRRLTCCLMEMPLLSKISLYVNGTRKQMLLALLKIDLLIRLFIISITFPAES